MTIRIGLENMGTVNKNCVWIKNDANHNQITVARVRMRR